MNLNRLKSAQRATCPSSFVTPIRNKSSISLKIVGLSSLQTYFKRYTQEARSRVKHIVIDMYAPYISLIKELFPQAKIVLDPFHLVQHHLPCTEHKTRIRFMKQVQKAQSEIQALLALILKVPHPT